MLLFGLQSTWGDGGWTVATLKSLGVIQVNSQKFPNKMYAN